MDNHEETLTNWAEWTKKHQFRDRNERTLLYWFAGQVEEELAVLKVVEIVAAFEMPAAVVKELFHEFFHQAGSVALPPAVQVDLLVQLCWFVVLEVRLA